MHTFHSSIRRRDCLSLCVTPLKKKTRERADGLPKITLNFPTPASALYNPPILLKHLFHTFAVAYLPINHVILKRRYIRLKNGGRQEERRLCHRHGRTQWQRLRLTKHCTTKPPAIRTLILVQQSHSASTELLCVVNPHDCHKQIRTLGGWVQSEFLPARRTGRSRRKRRVSNVTLTYGVVHRLCGCHTDLQINRRHHLPGLQH